MVSGVGLLIAFALSVGGLVTLAPPMAAASCDRGSARSTLSSNLAAAERGSSSSTLTFSVWSADQVGCKWSSVTRLMPGRPATAIAATSNAAPAPTSNATLRPTTKPSVEPTSAASQDLDAASSTTSGTGGSPFSASPGGAGGGGPASIDSFHDFFSIRIGIGGLLPVAAWLSTTTLGLLVFGWMLRRPLREDGSPRATVLSMVAAAGAGVWRDAPQPPERAASEPRSQASDTTSDDGSLLPFAPREVRLTGNRPTGWQSRPPLHFDLPPATNVVRRQITSRLVRLSDAPDDLRSKELLRLDRGDEIEILGQEESYLQVRTPTGAIGWVPILSIIG